MHSLSCMPFLWLAVALSSLSSFGHPQIALEFLSDCKSKFLMSLEVGRMDEALEAAKALNDKVRSQPDFHVCFPPHPAAAHI